MSNSKPLSTSELTQEVAIRQLSGDGMAALPAVTVFDHFQATLDKNATKNALHVKDLTTKQWKTWTWQEYRNEVDAFGKALLKTGVEKFDVVNVRSLPNK